MHLFHFPLSSTADSNPAATTASSWLPLLACTVSTQPPMTTRVTINHSHSHQPYCCPASHQQATDTLPQPWQLSLASLQLKSTHDIAQRLVYVLTWSCFILSFWICLVMIIVILIKIKVIRQFLSWLGILEIFGLGFDQDSSDLEVKGFNWSLLCCYWDLWCKLCLYDVK